MKECIAKSRRIAERSYRLLAESRKLDGPMLRHLPPVGALPVYKPDLVLQAKVDAVLGFCANPMKGRQVGLAGRAFGVQATVDDGSWPGAAILDI